MSFGADELVSEVPEKPIEDYTEDDIRKMFVEMFFWVADNRPSWLQECINKKKAMIQRLAKWRVRSRFEQRPENSYRFIPPK